MSSFLVVVDMQNDFVSGALGSPEAQTVLPKVIEKIKAYKGQIMYTRDTHAEDYLGTQEGHNLPIVHCVRDTEGWQLCPGIREQAEAAKSLIFDKEVFGSLSLAGCLSGIEKVSHIEEVELVGVCTDICVISNALILKAALPETKIIVDASCCAGVTPASHENALEAMKACQVEIH